MSAASKVCQHYVFATVGAVELYCMLTYAVISIHQHTVELYCTRSRKKHTADIQHTSAYVGIRRALLRSRAYGSVNGLCIIQGGCDGQCGETQYADVC
jgi:hypothetical protein